MKTLHPKLFPIFVVIFFLPIFASCFSLSLNDAGSIAKTLYKSGKLLWQGKTFLQTMDHLLDEKAGDLKYEQVKNLTDELSLGLKTNFYQLQNLKKSNNELSHGIKENFYQIQDVKNLIEEVSHEIKKQFHQMEYVKTVIHEFAHEIKQRFHRLEHSIEHKHFYHLVRHPMNTLFHQIQKFLDHPNNQTKDDLLFQCKNHPPLSTFEALIDILQKNFVEIVAKEDNFESTKFEELEKKLDHYVFIIVMSQSLCSSFYDQKNAEFDFRRLKTQFDSVSILFKKSRDYVMKNYFQHSKQIIKNFLPQNKTLDGSKEKMNFIVASHLLKHFEEHYNYGTRYSIHVGQDVERVFIGSMPYNSVYQFNYNGFFVLIFQIKPGSEDVPPQNILTNYTSMSGSVIKEICGNSFVCLLDQTQSSNLANSSNDMLASNGDVYHRSTYDMHKILHVASAIESNYTYRKLQPQAHGVLRIKDAKWVNENLEILPHRSELKIEVEEPVQKLFIESNFDVEEILAEESSPQINLKDFISLYSNNNLTQIPDILQFYYRIINFNFKGETISKIFEHDKFAKLKDIVTDLYEKRKQGYQPLATLGYTFRFTDEVTFPMYFVFNHVYNLFIAPLEWNRNTLKHICEERPPIKTLQAFVNMLKDDLIIKSVEYKEYNSTYYESLEIMLDLYVQIMVYSQSICSGFYNQTEAMIHFENLKKLQNTIVSILKTSRNQIQKTYFQKTKYLIHQFIWNLNGNETIEQRNYQIASQLLKHFEQYYNYGVRYGIQVGKNINRTWTGSMPHNSVYQSSLMGHKVLIYQIAPTNNESIGEEIYDQFKQKYSPEHDDIQKVCNTSLVCLCDYFGKVDSFFYQNEMKDIFVTNGVAHLYFPLKYLLHVAPAINANMTYRKLKPQIHNYRRISDFKYIDENLDVIDKKNLIPESYYPVLKLFSQTEIIFDENDIVSSPFPVKVQSKKSEEIKLWNFKFTIFGCCMLFIFLGICYGIYRLHIRNSSSEITNV